MVNGLRARWVWLFDLCSVIIRLPISVGSYLNLNLIARIALPFYLAVMATMVWVERTSSRGQEVAAEPVDATTPEEAADSVALAEAAEAAEVAEGAEAAEALMTEQSAQAAETKTVVMQVAHAAQPVQVVDAALRQQMDQVITQQVQQEVRRAFAQQASDLAAEQREREACVICMDNLRSHSFLPCMHRCVCAECADQVMRGPRQCPMCRASTAEARRAYL